MPHLNLLGQHIAYSVRSSKRAKRITVRYGYDTGLEVVYPVGTCEPRPEELLRGKSEWIIAAIEKIRIAQAKTPRRTYIEGEAFLFRGKVYHLKFTSNALQNQIKVMLRDCELVLSTPDPMYWVDVAFTRRAIESLYREEAKRYLPRRVSELAKRHGFEYNNVRIKNQKTRWGSCSVKRNINLNLRLMMAPDAAIDYVIIHELCHLREMSHNRLFWKLVESYCPEYQYWKSWFKQNGPSLIL